MPPQASLLLLVKFLTKNSIVISAEHGGTIMIPREEGLTRFYVQITGEKAARIAAARRRHREKNSSVGDTEIYDHGITPEEAIEQLNKIMAPWMVEFAGPMGWFAVWRGSSLCLVICLSHGLYS